MSSYLSKLLLTWLIMHMLQINTSISQKAQSLETKHVPGYRKINWAITGFDEPILHEHPFSEFAPLLKRTRFYPPINATHRYRLEFNEIYSRIPGVGRTTVNCLDGGEKDSPWCLPENQTTFQDCETSRDKCQSPPKNFSALRIHSRLYKHVHVILYAERKRKSSLGIKEKWIPAELEGVLLQGNHNPAGVAIPTGEFYLDEEFRCVDCELSNYGQVIPTRKRPATEVIHPTLLGFHYQMKWATLDDNFVIAGNRSEVHANFRWYSVPCGETRRLQFTLLAVHSFKHNIYDILDLGPYEVHYAAQANHSDTIPSPVFLPLFYHDDLSGTWCHAANALDIQTVRTPIVPFKKFETSHSYDACVRDEANPRRKHIGDIRQELDSFVCEEPEQPKCNYWNEPQKFKEQTFSDFSELACPSLCREVLQNKTQEDESNSDHWFKRSAHGAILVMTNFCIIPITTFVARFYKETYNVKNVKGQKSWFWFHLIGSMISSALVYFGTFQPGPDQNHTPHVYSGKVYVIILAMCYFSAWGRHKNHWCNISLEFVHGCLGYTTIIMAHVTIHLAPDHLISFVPKLLCDIQIFLHALFMIVVTFDICIQDNSKFGMKPRRRHFPTVEARFDDIELPNHTCRKVLLYFLAVVTFCCSFGSNFFH